MPIITIVGIGLAKKVVQVHGVDAEGKVVGARKLRRKEVLAFSPSCPGAPSTRHGCPPREPDRASSGEYVCTKAGQHIHRTTVAPRQPGK